MTDKPADEPEEDRSDGRVRSFLTLGGQMVGGAAGTAIGLLGGPALAIAGGAAGVAIGEGLAAAAIEFYERRLAPRQAERAATALALAAVEINDRLERGDEPRPDFADGDGREQGEELLEGVVLAAANAYEQRKVPFFANFFATLAFDPDIAPSRANMLLNLANRLTYRQLVVLSVFGDEAFREALQVIGTDREQYGFVSAPEIVTELDDLGTVGLIGIGQDDGTVARVTALDATAKSFEHMGLHGVRLTDEGEALFRLMRLGEVSQEEQEAVIRDLAGTNTRDAYRWDPPPKDTAF